MKTSEQLMTDLVLAEACGDQARAIAIAKVINARKRARDNRRARESAMRDCGLVKVRGNLGGTYWE
jgi:hypothetical protein